MEHETSPTDGGGATAAHKSVDTDGGQTRGAFLSDGEAWAFDDSFFGVSPAEARCMDPQQRIMLEVSRSTTLVLISFRDTTRFCSLPFPTLGEKLFFPLVFEPSPHHFVSLHVNVRVERPSESEPSARHTGRVRGVAPGEVYAGEPARQRYSVFRGSLRHGLDHVTVY